MDDGIKPLPFPAAYWVIPGRLLAGQFPGDRCIATATDKLTGLLNCGVRRVVNLMEADETNHQGELFRPYEGELSDLAAARNQFVTFVRYPIPDMGVPSQQQMRLILDDLDRSLAQGDVVYVHCWGGVGRTGTVVGCFLARHGLVNGTGALARIAVLRQYLPGPWRFSPETLEQRQLVERWREGE